MTRSRLLTRAVVPFVLAQLGGGAAASIAGAAPPQTAQVAPMADPAGSADEFGACLRSRDTASVVLLVDESQSLEESDPAAQRVTAAGHLVTEWKLLSERGGVTLNVQTMAFSESTTPGAWRNVATENAVLLADVEAFAGRHSGQQTDYWMALNGARASLSQADPTGQTCQAIVWFSDGKLDAFPRYTVDGSEATKPYLSSAGSPAEASAAAAADLCRSGGLVDQLRSTDISLFAIGLNAGTSVPADFQLMQALATASAGPDGQPCGGVPADGKGWFKLATDIGGLIASFDELILPDATVATTSVPICQKEVCAQFAHTFVLDNSLTWVHVLARSEVKGLDLYVRPPNGEPAKVTGSFSVGAVQGTSKAYDEQTINIDLIEPAGNWAGQWSIIFVDPSGSSTGLQSQTSISMAADLTPTVEVPTKVYADEPLEGLVLGLQRGSDEPVDPASLQGTVAVQAVLVDAAGGRVPLVEDGTATAFGNAVTVDLTDVAVGRGRVVVDLAVTTAPTTVAGAAVPGTALKPTTAEYAVDVLPPLGYPTVATTAINFGTWDQDAPPAMTAPLHVVGPGCVWLGETRMVSGPQRAGTVGVAGLPASGTAAVCLVDGEERDIPMTLSAQASGNGGLTGDMVLSIAAADAKDRPRLITVAYSADLNRPPNLTGAWATGVIAVLLGVAIPLALMYFLKWRSARIRPFGGLVGGELPVVVTATGIERPGIAGLLDTVELRDILPIPSRGVRELRVGQVQLRVRTGWSPFSAAQVEATLPGAVGVSSAQGAPRTSGAARLPLTLQHEWVLFHAPTGPAEHAVVVLFAAGGTARPDLEKRLLTLGADVPGLVERIRASAGVAVIPPGAPADPFGMPPAGGPVAADPFAAPAGVFGAADVFGSAPSNPGSDPDPSLLRTTPRHRTPQPPAGSPTTGAQAPTGLGVAPAGPAADPGGAAEADPFAIDWSTLSFDDRNPST